MNTPTEVLDPETTDLPIPAITAANEIEALADRFALEAQTDLRMAEAVQVTDDQSYEQAGQLRVAIDKKRKGGEGIVETVCGPLYAKWKAFRGLLMRPVETRTQALKVLSDKRLAYEREQQRKAEEARRLAEEAARREQERLNRLALERAARAEAKGDMARAEEILESVPQVPIPPPLLEPPVSKTKGVAKVTYYSARVTDLAALVTAVAAGEVPLDAILPNQAWLDRTAKALRQSMKYPGVQVVNEEREKSTGR